MLFILLLRNDDAFSSSEADQVEKDKKMEKIDDEQENKLDQQNSAIEKELIQQKEENNEYEFEVENKEEIQNKQEDDINDDYNSFVQNKNDKINIKLQYNFHHLYLKTDV